MVNKSIDDATPEEWNALRKKPATLVADTWNNIYNDDNEPNDHPVFGENIPDNSTKFDSVSKPAHYNNGGMECIEAIEGMLDHDEYIGYLRGNSLKYRWRYRYKGKPMEDLRKAEWYEKRLMDYLMRHPSEQLR